MVDTSIAVNDIQEKLRILLDYWIEHNSEHEKEIRDWADKVPPASTEAVRQLRKAAAKMAEVNEELVKARQALPRSKGRH